MENTSSESIRCSFCGLLRSEVECMIQGPSPLYICDQCIALAAELVENAKKEKEKNKQTMVKATANFPSGSLGEELMPDT